MSNEEIIWDYLYEKIRNPYGVAALMGNLFAESSLNPLCANGVKKYGMSYSDYTGIVDSGMSDAFVTDGIAYGLVQWCYKTRKRALLDFAREQGKSIGDVYLQLDFLWYELQSYKTVLNALCMGTNIKEISDIVMLKYERPANKSDAAKEKRAKYANKYYLKYGIEDIKISITENVANNILKEIEGKIQ